MKTTSEQRSQLARLHVDAMSYYDNAAESAMHRRAFREAAMELFPDILADAERAEVLERALRMALRALEEEHWPLELIDKIKAALGETT